MDELIQSFDQAQIRYLLIGGQAMRLEGMPRFSMDWDFFIPPKDADNIARINRVMGDELDAPLIILGPRGEGFVQTYQTRWGVIQFHLGVSGLPKFDEVERFAVTHHTETGTPVKCLSGNHLLASKQAANRPQDLQDIAFLLEKQKAKKLT
jgi:hypothetical protein